jgi:hypothetical protein
MDSGRTPELVVPLSKRKIALLLLGAVAFVCAGYWMWSIADTQTRFNPLFMKLLGVASIFLCGIGFILGCIKLLDSRPGFVIDREGIVDNSSFVSAGRIPWADVIGWKIATVSGQRFLMIEVIDPEKYLARAGALARMLYKANIGLIRSPINISSNALCLNFDELVKVMGAAFELYKGKNGDKDRS